jgi:hypothetical protein
MNRLKTIRLMACLILSWVAAGNAQTDTVHYLPSSDDFPNPERGFYSHREVQAEGSPLTMNDLINVRSKNQSLILRMYYLKKFRTSDLSAAELNLMSTDFSLMRSAGVKCILRFAYSSSETEADAPLSTILRHLDQLRPVFEANSDVIAVVQAGFIGAWGEWYYSTNGLNNTADRRTVLEKVLTVVPANWMVQVRTPNYKKEIFGITEPLTSTDAFSGTDVSRTGHHNDCFLASYDDYGTYQDTVADKIYLSLDTKFTPMGGETCALSEFSSCENALHELARMHWSFLNRDYNAAVLNPWITDGCMEEVKRRLGYRFEFIKGLYSDSVRPGSGMSIEITFTNTGWAAPFNPRRVEVMLRSLADSSVYFALLPEEPRLWLAGDTNRIIATVGVPANVPAGSYALLLRLSDPSISLRSKPEYCIRFANDSVWGPASGYNALRHIVTVDPSAPGTPYADSLFFRPLNLSQAVPARGQGYHPLTPMLLGNYPNPFNGETAIAYSLPRREHIVIRLYTVLGQEIKTLGDSIQDEGRHDFHVEAKDLASGVYYYTIATTESVQAGRLVLVR